MDNHWTCVCGHSAPNRVNKCPQCGRPNPESKHSADNTQDDIAFPAGMHSRSPLLEYINKLDNKEEAAKPKKQHREKEPARANQRLLDPDFIDIDSDYDKPKSKSRWPFFEKSVDSNKQKTQVADDLISFGDEDEEKQHPQEKQGSSIFTTIISIILVILLIVGTLYVLQNYEELTKLLAAPTVPEYLKP